MQSNTGVKLTAHDPPDRRFARMFAGAMVAMAGVPAFGADSIFGPAPLPDWVKAAAAEKPPIFPGTPKAVVLLDETTISSMCRCRLAAGRWLRG